MAEHVDDLTIQYEDEDGTVTCKVLDKTVLSKGAWATLMYKYQDLNRTSGEYGPEKVSIRRYQKRDGVYRPKSKFNISSAKQAKQIIEILEGWFPEE